MIQFKSKLLGEDNWTEMPFGKYGDISITINAYENTKYPIYMKIYKNKNHCIKQRMCRLSLLSPEYLLLPDENLLLTKDDINTIMHIISNSDKNIFVKMTSELYDIFSDYNTNDDEIENCLLEKYKINDSNCLSFELPNYYQLLENLDFEYILKNNEKIFINNIHWFYDNIDKVLNLNEKFTIYSNGEYSIYSKLEYDVPSASILENNSCDYALISLKDYSIMASRIGDDYNHKVDTMITQLMNSPDIIKALHFDVYEFIILLWNKYRNIPLEYIEFYQVY